MTEHKMTTPAVKPAGMVVHALAGPSEFQYRKGLADNFEARFRAQAAGRVTNPAIMKAAVDTIRSTTMRHGHARGVVTAIDVAKRVAGIDLL